MRTDEEMQITLRTLQQSFGVDIAPAQGLSGTAMAAWLEQVEDAVFEKEYAELRAQVAQMEHKK